MLYDQVVEIAKPYIEFGELLSWPNFTPGTDQGGFENWHSKMASKILARLVNEDWPVDQVLFLGGICSIFTGDWATLSPTNFCTIDQFEGWLRSWYPRFDQVHDAVGIPPRGAQRLIYVCEDSLFARRISGMIKLEVQGLTEVLRQTHQELGHPIIERWLRQNGYRGKVEVVYTSDLERELEVGLRLWSRLLKASVASRHQDVMRVRMMYTAFWLDVLDQKGPAVVLEPANHGGINIKEYRQSLEGFFTENPYAQPGVNEMLGIAGYLPHWGRSGMTRHQPFTEVINRGNWDTFCFDEFTSLNILFGNAAIAERGREALQIEEIERRARGDLGLLYSS